MTAERVLVTGGAGFIGQHLVGALLERGTNVRVFDSLHPQVHGVIPLEDRVNASVKLNGADAEFIVGDVRDPSALADALVGVDAVVHLAARVGVGQSMYEVGDYLDQNGYGTAALLEAIIAHGDVRQVVVASSMSLYGEGAYINDVFMTERAFRTREQLAAKVWEPLDRLDQPLIPIATDEEKLLEPASVYALTKYVQEQTVIQVCDAYGINATALRLFNVYGPGQSLSNPYTGAIAIFASRMLNGRRPLVYEDGLQQRDFVSVHDVVAAFLLALRGPERAAERGGAGRPVESVILNIGSGEAHTLLEVITELCKSLNLTVEPELSESYRVGDIRHCFADSTLAKSQIAYTPMWSLSEGLRELSEWLITQKPPLDHTDVARSQLASRKLLK